MAGTDTKGHPAGTKTGDVIHIFQSGSIQMLTDVNIDPAGNVWAANNWNDARSGDVRRSVSTHLNLGRRVWPYRDLRSGRPSEAAAHGQGANVLTDAGKKTESLRSCGQYTVNDLPTFECCAFCAALAGCGKTSDLCELWPALVSEGETKRVRLALFSLSAEAFVAFSRHTSVQTYAACIDRLRRRTRL